MFSQSSYAVLMLGLLAATGNPAFAAEAPLEVASKVFVETAVTDADGSVRTRLAPANKAVPGDRVVFILAYRNTGTQPLDSLVFDNPIPAAIAYRAPSQGSASPELSIDGKTYGALDRLRVPVAQGGDRAARVEDVTHVRWRLTAPLPAGAKGQFAYQAVLK